MSWKCVTEPCRAVIKHERCLSWALEADVQSGRTGRPWASTQRFRPAFNDGLPRCPTESPQRFLVIQPAPSWACDSHAQRCARSNAHGNQKPAPAPSGSQAMAWHGMSWLYKAWEYPHRPAPTHSPQAGHIPSLTNQPLFLLSKNPFWCQEKGEKPCLNRTGCSEKHQHV